MERGYATCMSILGHVPSGVREAARGCQWASLGPLSTYTPIPPYLLSPVSLNLLTSHSLPFVNNIYMEDTPSPAERSRTILDILSELLAHPSSYVYRRKGHKGKRGVRLFFLHARLETLTNAICRRGVFQQAMQGMYQSTFV